MLLFEPLLPPKTSASAATAAAATSLGAPGSKHHSNGGSLAGGAPNPADEVEAEKPIRPSSRSPRSVHLITVLTFLCFLILYLISYEPSPLDLPRASGVERMIDQEAGSVSGLISAAVRKKRGLMEEKIRIRGRRLGRVGRA